MARIVTLISWVCSVFVLAGDGSIPIYQATTITAPGHYLVTRDFGVSGQDAVTIEANDVTLDLGGHSITMGTAHNGIVIGDGHGYITIRNGKIISPAIGVYFDQAVGITRLVIEDLDITYPTDSGIWIDNPRYVEINRCFIEMPSTYMSGDGIHVYSGDDVFTGSICDNVVSGTQGHGIYLNGISNAKVKGNQVQRFGHGGSAQAGLYVGVSSISTGKAKNNRIEGNLIEGEKAYDTDGIFVMNSENNLLLRNTVSFAGHNGIKVDEGIGDTVRENKANDNVFSGIHVTSIYGLVELNTAVGNGTYGLSSAYLNHPHYRNNLLLDNDLGPALYGTDAGGNIQ